MLHKKWKQKANSFIIKSNEHSGLMLSSVISLINSDYSGNNTFAHISRTFLGMLSDLSKVFMFSICLLYYNSCSRFSRSLGIVWRAPSTIGITLTIILQSFLGSVHQFSSRVQVFVYHFAFFYFHSLTLRRNSKVNNNTSSPFFVDYYKVWSLDWDYVIHLNLKIPEEFVRLIGRDRFWVVHITFVRMIKYKFLAQFPVNPIAHPVVFSLILILC